MSYAPRYWGQSRETVLVAYELSAAEALFALLSDEFAKGLPAKAPDREEAASRVP